MRLRALVRDERGAVAIAVALMMPVMVGLSALAVDVGNSRLIRNRLQSAADAGALAAVQMLADQAQARSRAVDFVAVNLPESFGPATGPDDVDFGAFDPSDGSFAPSLVDVNAIRVRSVREAARGNPAPRFFSAIFGNEPITISVSAIAARTITSTYQPPEIFNLAPEAADYNEVFAYCFDFEGGGGAASRRSSMTLIARNITPPVSYVWPECPEGQSLSFRLRNIRDARNNPPLRTSPKRTEYNHYSDTRIVDEREVFDFAGRSIIETMRCDTLDECKPTTQGGIVPAGKERVPNREDRPCVPGKFMYFGWEDRPPGLGWTDKDYDDIVFVMRCPTGALVTYGAARLVR